MKLLVKMARHRRMERTMMTRLLLIALLLTLGSSALSAQELRFLNAFELRYPLTKLVVQRYISNVEKATAGKVKFRQSGPEVVNAFQQFEPVSRGAFDLHFTVQPYHVGTTALSLGIYTLDPDPEAFRKSGLFEVLDKEYQRFNLKLLAIVPGSIKGIGSFHALLREPIGASGDIQGRRVRGNPYFKPFIDKAGGSMVVLQHGETYPALQRRTIDGAFAPVIGSMEYRWHEVAKYSLRPTFGYFYQFLLINTNSFARLSPSVQKIVVDEAARVEVPGMQSLHEQMLEDDVGLQKQGMVLSRMAQAKFEAALKGLMDGIWETVETSKATGARAPEFRAFLARSGLATQVR
ncbi:MAG TPA: TRAP transporter substrate-binding protein DctP [Lysobacter sp.]|nr:TRAP transporter substrate-binding protein DctP [Lysobacter sp.]